VGLVGTASATEWVVDCGPVMFMGCRPPASDGKQCSSVGRLRRAEIDRFDWCSDSPGGRMSGGALSQRCFLGNLHCHPRQEGSK